MVRSRGASPVAVAVADADAGVASSEVVAAPIAGCSTAGNSYETGRTAEGAAWGTHDTAPPTVGDGATGHAEVEGHEPLAAAPVGIGPDVAGWPSMVGGIAVGLAVVEEPIGLVAGDTVAGDALNAALGTTGGCAPGAAPGAPRTDALCVAVGGGAASPGMPGNV